MLVCCSGLQKQLIYARSEHYFSRTGYL